MHYITSWRLYSVPIFISCTSSKKNTGLHLIVALLLRDDPTVRNRLNRSPTRRDCDNVWAPLKFNDCLAWPLTSNSNRMLSLLAMFKLVTLKGCFHDMQRNAEQQRVKYYRNKRHRPTFKPALSGLPAQDSIKDWTVSTAQAIRLHGVYKDGPSLHPLHQSKWVV